MQLIKTSITDKTSFFVLVCILIIYVVSRSVCMDITHDEAYSFYNVKHFWYVETLCTGNTHWFNFAAIKTAVLLGLEKTWQLRWFSILSAIVFLITGYYWINTLKEVAIKWMAFLITFLNPYLLDYLSLARGYATGLMFEALSLCFLFILLYKNKQIFSFPAIFCAGMSAIANFNFFYFFSAFCMVYFYAIYFKRGICFLKEKRFYRDVLFSLLIVFLVLRALLFITECSNDIGAYGGNRFIDSFFYGFVDGFIYKNFAVTSQVIFGLSCILFVFLACASLYGIINCKKHNNIFYLYCSCILCFILALALINKFCFHVLYPTYRTTLMLFPLITINSVCFFQEVLKGVFLKKIVLYGLSFLIIFNFVKSMNVTSTFDYPQQADAKKAFLFIETLKAKHVGIAPELFGVFRNYYQQTDRYQFSFIGKSINTAIPIGIGENTNALKEFEYLLLFPPYQLSFYKNNAIQLRGVKYYPNTGTLIVKVAY